MEPEVLQSRMAAPLAIVAALAVSQLVPAAVAEAPSNLKCDAMLQADGSLMLQLSGISQFPTDCHSSSWADKNTTGHVFARNDEFLKESVKSLTNVSITFKKCHNYTYYRHDCKHAFQAHCYANCSFLPEDVQQANVTNNICFSESWCMDKWTFTVSVSVIAILVVLVLFGLYKLYKRYQTRQMLLNLRAQYTSQDNVEMWIMEVMKEEIV